MVTWLLKSVIMFVSYSILPKPIKLFIWNRMKSNQVTLMLTWDWCKMLNIITGMICMSCVPYPKSTSLYNSVCYFSVYSRKKRQVYPHVGTHTMCNLFVVADYYFFENIGNKDKRVTGEYLVCIVEGTTLVKCNKCTII